MRVRCAGAALLWMTAAGCATPDPVEPCATNSPFQVPPRGQVVSQLGTSNIEKWAGGPEGLLAVYDGATVRIYDPDRELVIAEQDATGEELIELSWRDARTLRLRSGAGTTLWEWRTGRVRLALPSALTSARRVAEVRPTPFGYWSSYEGPKGPTVVVSVKDDLRDDDSSQKISHFAIGKPALDATVVGMRVFVTLQDATEVFTLGGKSVAKLPACTYVEPSSDSTLVALEVENGDSHMASGCGDECWTNLRNVFRGGAERHEIHVFDAVTLKPIAKFPGRSARFRPGQHELFYLGPREGKAAKKGVTASSLMKWSGTKDGEKIVDVPELPFSGDSNQEVGRSTSWSSDGQALIVGKSLWQPNGKLEAIAEDFREFLPNGDLLLESQKSLDVVTRAGAKRFHFDKPQGTWDCDLARRDLSKYPVAFCEHSDSIVRLSLGKPAVALPKRVNESSQLPCLRPSFIADRKDSPDARMTAQPSGKGIELTMRDGGAKRRLDHWDEVDRFTWNPKANIIAASAGSPSKTRVWDAETGQLLVEIDGETPKWSHDGASLYVLADKGVSIWERIGGPPKTIPLATRGRFGGVHPVAEGTFITVASDTIELWDSATGTVKLKAGRVDLEDTPSDFATNSVAVSGDGKYVAIASAMNAAIDVYETATLAHVQSFAGIRMRNAAVFWHPTRPVVGLLAPGVGTIMYRVGDTRRLWLRAKAMGNACARAFYDDAGRFDAEPAGYGIVAVNLGPDAATADILTKGPLFERHLAGRLADTFIGVE